MNLRNTLRKTAAATLFAASAVTGVMLGSTAASAYNEAQAAPPVVETVEPAPLEVETVSVEVETAPVEVPESGEPLMEDEAGWDCRINGNEMCGVQIEGTWYVVTFDDGQPVTVAVR